jgi:hypothetical protein
MMIKLVTVFQKIAYLVSLGCVAGLVVIRIQPKNAELDTVFNIVLSVGCIISLGVVFGAVPLVTHITVKTALSQARVADPKSGSKELLVKVAMEHADPMVRSGLVKKLTDQAVLAKVAMEDMQWIIRNSAVKRLTDQAALAKVAMEDADWIVRKSAVRRLTDQAALAHVAVNDNDRCVREAAVEHLRDQAVLAKVAKDDVNMTVRSQAEYWLRKLRRTESK